MSTLVIWIMGAGLLLYNIALRTQILQLKARLREQTGTQAYLACLRQHAAKGDIAAIKALRKKYPELSLIEANKLWQQIQ
ncbi:MULTISPECIES: hypothetical protein [Psychrobacter]|uniref:hypothetical protein n=1 Tax=Psychrobacter TaxID=497 RepID=UPI000EDC1231|nr:MULTISPECIES: hypothetical protein [Psychrobacter]MDE0490580.1 hypothetical protein [Psychrobacter sp. A3]HCH27260.1 hypothetical protein [Psychrobacter sp.]